jgi:hypothetical protein
VGLIDLSFVGERSPHITRSGYFQKFFPFSDALEHKDDESGGRIARPPPPSRS